MFSEIFLGFIPAKLYEGSRTRVVMNFAKFASEGRFSWMYRLLKPSKAIHELPEKRAGTAAEWT